MRGVFKEATTIYVELGREEGRDKTLYTIFENGEIIDKGCLSELVESERKEFFEKVYRSKAEIVYGELVQRI